MVMSRVLWTLGKEEEWSYMKCKRRAVGAYVMANIKNQDVREKWGSWRSLSDERRLSREY